MPMPRATDHYPTFFATDEATGVVVTLRVLPGLRGVPTPSDPTGRIPGPRRLVDDEGRPVERIAKGEYRTAAGVRLTSDEPGAP